MFTDFGKKPLLTNWLPWQQGNVYFLFLRLKILLIPSYEKSPNFDGNRRKTKKVINRQTKFTWKTPPPCANRVNLYDIVQYSAIGITHHVMRPLAVNEDHLSLIPIFLK